MKCDQAQTWLLMSDVSEVPSAAVLQHLETCTNCRAIQQQLTQIEQSLQRPAEATDFQRGKTEFLKRFFEATPLIEVSSIVAKAKPASSRSQRARWSVAISVAVLLGTFISGWLLSTLYHRERQPTESIAHKSKPGPALQNPPPGLPTETYSPTQPPVESVANAPRAEYLILGPFVENHVRLAKSVKPEERLELVYELSDLLWDETVRQIELGTTSELTELSQLYLLVIDESLPRVAANSEELEQELPRRIARLLQERQGAAQQIAANTIPAVSELFTQLANHTDQAATAILVRKPPGDRQPIQLPTRSANLLGQVVFVNARMAELDSPLERAKQSCDLADELSQAIVFTSLDGEAAASEKLGEYLSDVVDQSVAVNLARFDPAQADGDQKMEYEALKKRSKHSTDVLQRNLDKAPETAKKGLQRALEAQQRHPGKGPPHQKPASGKPKPGKSRDFIPPGLRNRVPKSEKD